MRIALFTIGARGDTEPFLALAVRLAGDGHQVTLAARPDFAELSARYGIPFVPLGHEYRSFMRGSAAALGSGNPIALVRYGLSQRRSFMVGIAEAEWRAAQGADAIVFKYSWFAGYSLAEKLGVPCIAAMPFPMTPTQAFPCFWLFGGHDRGRRTNRLLWRLSEQVTWQIGRGEDTRLRRELLDLPPLPVLGPLERQAREGIPVLYAYSPTLLPPPPDWQPRFHVTGAWSLDPPPGWRPPADLVAFLDAGPPPIYVGFGSMTSADPDATLDLVLEAPARAGQRGVLLRGWADLGTGRELPATVFAVDDVPHGWLFPRMAAIVHHGGAGTTAAALRAGVPAVITPLTADQPSWARIVYRLGRERDPRAVPAPHRRSSRPGHLDGRPRPGDPPTRRRVGHAYPLRGRRRAGRRAPCRAPRRTLDDRAGSDTASTRVVRAVRAWGRPSGGRGTDLTPRSAVRRAGRNRQAPGRAP